MGFSGRRRPCLSEAYSEEVDVVASEFAPLI
jgi:hypothetical protein